MQVLTPTTQALTEGHPRNDASAGNIADDSPFLDFNAQRGKYGIFARLLEALTGKGKSEALPESMQLPDGAELAAEGAAETAAAAGGDSFAWPLSGGFNYAVEANARIAGENSGQGFLAEADVFDGEDVSGGLSGFLRQDLLAEQGPGGQNRAGALNSPSGGMDYHWPLHPKEAPLSELLPQKAGESQDFGLSQGRVEAGSAGSSGAGFSGTGLSGAEAREANSGNTGAESFLAKHSETEPAQSQAMYRPDAARLAGGEGENSLHAGLRDNRGRPLFEVRDLRTRDWRDPGINGPNANGTYADFSRSVGYDALRPALHQDIAMSVDIRASAQEGDGWTARNSGKVFSQSQFFEDALARELRGNLSLDLVKNATLIVRNGGEGTIRLALHPASLGYVKVHLEMTENKIMGHIIVESNEALRAFQRELPVLEKAFKDSGFLETSLEMSLANDGSDYGAGQQRQERDLSAMDAVMAASRYDAGTEQIEDTLVSDNTILPASTERKTVNIFI